MYSAMDRLNFIIMAILQVTAIAMLPGLSQANYQGIYHLRVLLTKMHGSYYNL